MERRSIAELDEGWQGLSLQVEQFRAKLCQRRQHFLYEQTVQLKQAEVRLRVTERCKRRRVIASEMCLNGDRNSRKAWWTGIQDHLEVIENILQRHVLRSLYPSTEKEEHTICSRVFRRIQHEICRRTKITRARTPTSCYQ